jgi:hypothetical protein
MGIGDWGIGDWGRWGPLWGTRGPHSPKGVGIRGEGVMGIGELGAPSGDKGRVGPPLGIRGNGDWGLGIGYSPRPRVRCVPASPCSLVLLVLLVLLVSLSPRPVRPRIPVSPSTYYVFQRQPLTAL